MATQIVSSQQGRAPGHAGEVVLREMADRGADRRALGSRSRTGSSRRWSTGSGDGVEGGGGGALGGMR